MEMFSKKAIALLLMAGWFSASMAQTVNNLNANIVVAAGTTVNITGDVINAGALANGGTVKLSGDFTNNGTGGVGSGEVQFNGTAGLQNINGSTVTAFGNLTVNNNNDVWLGQNALVNGTLNFADGKVVTNAYKISVAAGGTVTGAAAGQYVDGNLEKFIAVATASKNFEIGDGSNYTPVSLNFSGSTNGTGSLTAYTTPGDHPQVVSSGIDPNASVNRYWTITNGGVTGYSSYNATFNFINPGDLDAGANPSNFITRQYNGGWSVTGTGTRTSTSTQATGMTTFSDYEIGTLISGYVWTGLGANDNWTTAGNWTPGVPPNLCGSNVIIPTGSPRTPTLTGNVSIGNVSLGDGKTIDLGSNTLSTCGNWTGGTTTASTVIGAGSVILTGNAAQTMTGKTGFSTLHVDKGGGSAVIQANSFFDVFTALELENGNLNSGTGTLTLRSTATSHAIFNDFGATYGSYHGTFTGTIYEERYYRATSANSYNQHFMGSPVSNADLAQFGAGGTSGAVTPTANCDETQLDQNSVYGSVFSYDQAIGSTCPLKSWTVVASGNNADPGNGYSVAKTGAGVLTVHGAPNTASSYSKTGLQNSNWTKGTLQHNSPTAFGSGWQLVSNPYNATLDFGPNGTNQAATGIDNQIQIWDVIQGQYFVTTVVAPFQAYFVKKNSNPGNTYIIDGTKRVVTPHTFYAQNTPEQLTITASNNANNLYDVTTVGFNANATDQFDAEFDANKFTGTIGRHNLSTQNNGYELNKNILNSISQTSTVNMTFEPGQSGNYTLNFGGVSSFDPTSYITLEDTKLNVFYDVRNGDYNFASDVADNWNRFVLHFTPPAQIATTDQTCDADGAISVSQPGTAAWTYTITDNNMAIVSTGTLSNNAGVTVQAPAGTYILTLVDANNYTVVKPITVNGAQPVNAAFTPSATNVETTVDVTFTSNTANATTYAWNFGDNATGTGQTAIHHYANPGTYTVTLAVTGAGGCSSTTTQTITVTQTNTGLSSVLHTTPALNIWGNENRVYIDFTKQGKVEAEIQIFNVLGQQLSNEKFGRSTIYSKPIANLEAAYVIVRVNNEGVITTRKVFISNIK